jgi:mRNA export factor
MPTPSLAMQCHRDTTGNKVRAFSVNDIAVHPKFKSFATCGSDGTYAIWDKDTKRRIHNFNKGLRQVTSGSFDATGMYFCYASCYDWSLGEAKRSKPGGKCEIRCVKLEESWVRT